MLRDKDTIIISELKNFFTSSEKAIYTLFDLMSSLTFSEKQLGLPQSSNTRYRSFNSLLLLLLFPLFEIQDVFHYRGSALSQFASCGKDVFYRLLNNPAIDWRSLSYRLNTKLIRKTESKSEDSGNPRCLIIDDTDLPKSGRRIELLGRVFSHVTHGSILAFKGLFLSYHDGKSLFGLDFSLHGEKGKNEKKPQGLTAKQAKLRFSKKRDKSSPGEQRQAAYFNSKIDTMLGMVKRAISQGIRFDYLLVDSWFTCLELVQFIQKRRIGCRLLGMIKMGKTKYDYNGKSLTSKEIVDVLRRKKKTKRSKLLNCFYGEALVKMKGIEVKLFFCKFGHKGKWNGMLTTDLTIDFEQAYKIYSTRWSIEVFFKESKQYLRLGKCQSQDFDAQIAATTICMMQYNLLSVVKRFQSYETLGELFRQSTSETAELTINERIWLIITKIVAQLALIVELDPQMLMEKLFSENEKLTNLINIKPFLQAG
jgi:hypothetical protein